MELKDFRPQSKLVTRATRVERPRFPAIDAHNHLNEAFGGGWDQRPVQELLDLLESRGIRKAVASSTEQPAVNERLAMTGLLPRFKVVVAGNDVKNLKPAPDLFFEAARRMQAMPEDCLVVEDTAFGSFAALSARIPVILVPDIAPIPSDLAALTVGVFPSLVEVRQFLLDQDLK